MYTNLLKQIVSLEYLFAAVLVALFFVVGKSYYLFSILTTNQTVLFITLIWLFHIFIDRAMGYGLKHSNSFHHTHLGKIGKEKNK